MKNIIDFTNCKNVSDFAKVLKDNVPSLTSSLCKRIGFEIKNNNKRRIFTATQLVQVLKDQEESKKFYEQQSGKEKNDFAYPYEFDEVRMSYLLFLNREDHNNKKEFQYMTEHEWIDYFVKQFNYPKPIAKKCGVSMYKFLRERSLDITTGKIEKYPLHPLLEDK